MYVFMYDGNTGLLQRCIFALIRTSSALCIVTIYRTVNAGFHSKGQSVNAAQGNDGCYNNHMDHIKCTVGANCSDFLVV